jgi:hypothetical protein
MAALVYTYCQQCGEAMTSSSTTLCERCSLVLQTHPDYDDCTVDECAWCAIRACPVYDSMHYHHDGCPSCTNWPQEDEKKEDNH